MNIKLIDFIYFGTCLSVVITVFHALIWILSPIYSIYPVVNTWSLLVLFHAIFIITLALLWFLFKSKEIHIGSNIKEAINSVSLKQIMILASIGIILHFVAKSQLLLNVGIECFSVLRNAWTHSSHDSVGVFLRLTSILGFTLSHFSMLGLFIATYRISGNILDAKSWIVLIVCIILLQLFSIAIVSRMTILTALMIVFISGLMSVFTSNQRLHTLGRATVVMIVMTLSAVVFNSYIFSNKVDCSGQVTHLAYTQSNLKGFAAKIIIADSTDPASLPEGINVLVSNAEDKFDSVQSMDPDAQLNLVNSLTSSVSDVSDVSDVPVFIGIKKFIINNFETSLPTFFYLNHGVLNFSQILATSDRGDSELIKVVDGYLSKFGIDILTSSLNKGRIYGGGGPTFVGAVFHDFGIIGVVVTAILLAIFFVFSLFLLAQKKFIWLGIAILISLSIIILMSFIFVAPYTLSFPFVVFVFLYYFVYNHINSS